MIFVAWSRVNLAPFLAPTAKGLVMFSRLLPGKRVWVTGHTGFKGAMAFAVAQHAWRESHGILSPGSANLPQFTWN
jgi:hypothetical protein